MHGGRRDAFNPQEKAGTTMPPTAGEKAPTRQSSSICMTPSTSVA